MADLFADEPVSLQDMIRCVEREIELREQVYPRLVKLGRMKPAKAQWETKAMKAVLVHLQVKQEV